MNFRLYCSRRRLLAGCLVLSLSLSAVAMPPPDGKGGGFGPACDMGMRGPAGAPMGPAPGMFGVDRPPPFLRGLKLTDDQQDKVFAIMHAAAPGLRDQFKAVHKAREALHDLGRAVQFDNGNASSLAQSLGNAESQLALLQARADHDIYAVLTDEQRGQVAQHDKDPGLYQQGPDEHEGPRAH